MRIRHAGLLLFCVLSGCASNATSGATRTADVATPTAPRNWVEALPAYPAASPTAAAGEGVTAVLQPVPSFTAHAVSPDRRRIVGQASHGVAVIDTETGLTVFQRKIRGTGAWRDIHVGGGWLALGGSSAMLLNINQSMRPFSGQRVAVSGDGRRLALQTGSSLRVADAAAEPRWRTLVEGGVRGSTALSFSSDGSWLLAHVRTGLERIEIESGARSVIVESPGWSPLLTPNDLILVPTEEGLRAFEADGALRWSWMDLPAGEVYLSTDATGTVGIVAHRESVTILDLETGAVRGQFPPLRDPFVASGLGAIVGLHTREPRLLAYRLLDGQPMPLPTDAMTHAQEVDATRALVSSDAHFGLLDLRTGDYVWRREVASSIGASELEVLPNGGVSVTFGRVHLTWPAGDAAPSIEERASEQPREGDVVFENDAGRARRRAAGITLEIGGREVELEDAQDVGQLHAAGRRWLATVEQGSPKLLLVHPRSGVVQAWDISGAHDLFATAHAFIYRAYSREWFVAERSNPTRRRSLGRSLVAEGGGQVVVLQGQTIMVYGAERQPRELTLPEELRRPRDLDVLDDGRLLLRTRERAAVLSSTDGTVISEGPIIPGGPWPRVGTRFAGCHSGEMRVVDVGSPPRDLGPCLEAPRLSSDGRYLIGRLEGAARVLDLEAGRSLTLHVVRRGLDVTIAVADDRGRIDHVGAEEVIPVAMRTGRVESGTIARVDTPRTRGLYEMWWAE